jgi:transcriptional regulator with XRE-family HTH domain
MKNSPQDPSPATQEQWQHFGALLRDRRNAAELSRSELATKAKLSAATIKFIETARHRPSRTTLLLLLKVVELNLTWVDVPGQHEPPKPNEPVLLPETPAPSPMEPKPDPAQFLMNLMGFDEISLPAGSPKTLRLFQERPKTDESRR